MVDHVDTAKRSLMMAAVHSKHTKPELVVRKIAFMAWDIDTDFIRRSFRAKPDLVFAGKRKADIRSWMFLASSSQMPVCDLSQDKNRILGCEIPSERRSR